MTDSGPDGREAEVPGGKSRWTQRGVLGAVCALVIGVYAYTAHSGFLITSSLKAADTCYNLLVQSFRAGQLNLRKELPPGFAQLADPYDPAAHVPYGMLDVSYYKGKLYLYFGVTPVLVLFWPYVALTGHYLFQKDAAVIFCTVGFLASVSLLWALWRRYFAEVSIRVVAAGTLALGLTTLTPLLLARCDVYEVSVSCGYALTMLALVLTWKALHEPERRGRWLAAASLAYGLALGARPSLLPGAVILLAPVAQVRREHRKLWVPLMAAAGPIVLIGLGLMLYNALRFDNPFEFGWHYQLAGDRQNTVHLFDLGYLWFNFRLFFLEPARWSGRFPFVHGIKLPPLPAGHAGGEHPFGILTNIPLVWLAVAVPLAWRNRSAEARSTLCGFLAVLALLFGVCALTLCFLRFANSRYEVEFLPALVLLAVIGILGLERALAPTSESGPVWRRVVRCGWGLLLGFSVAFNLLASVERCGLAHYDLGSALLQQRRVPEAIAHFERALRLKPDIAEAHNNLGSLLKNQGRMAEAIAHYEQALQLKPDFAAANYNLGLALSQTGKLKEAITHWELALQFKPDFAEAHNNLGSALVGLGRVPEAIAHYEQALRLKPDFAEAHYNLGFVLKNQGQMAEAIAHYEQALRLKPDYADVHNSLGSALFELGRVPEAIAHYEQALRLKPDFAQAENNLGIAWMQLGKVSGAITHYEQALRINPDYPEAQYDLGVALDEAGRVSEAIGHYEQALRLKPDFAEAHYSLGLALKNQGRMTEAIAHYEQALRIRPDYADAHNSLGNASLAAGKIQDAIGHYEQALQIKPDFAEAHYNLGVALQRAGQIQEAMGHYEQALRLKPDFAEAANALARLRTAR